MGRFAIEYPARGGTIPFPDSFVDFVQPGNNATAKGVVPLSTMSDPDTRPSFEHTTLPHLDAAYNLARWLLRNDHDAEDAVQDAYLRAQKAFGSFRGGDGRPWILTIVRNVCYTVLRRSRRGLPTEAFDDSLHGSPDLHADANAAAWREARAERLEEAMARLPAEFSEVIVLHELEGLSYREIAQVADVPIGTVMSRLARARQKLQAGLTGAPTKDSPHGL